MAKSLNGLSDSLRYAETDDDWGAGDQYSNTLLKTNILKSYNLYENQNMNDTNDTKKQKKITQTGVIVNGKVYHFSLEELIKKEPNNNLLNIHVGEIKKRVNQSNHTIEYMEQIPDFNLVIDYINGYNYKDFSKVFKIDYSRFEKFRLLLNKLGMMNLVSQLDSLYPLLNINGIMISVSSKFINMLEPNNKLFSYDRQQSNNVFAHFRDREIFNEYFRDYLLGKKTLSETADYINKLKNLETIKTECYILAKIESDMEYYGLDKLRQQYYV